MDCPEMTCLPGASTSAALYPSPISGDTMNTLTSVQRRKARDKFQLDTIMNKITAMACFSDPSFRLKMFRKIGQGGFGQVFHCKDLEFEQHVAVKVIEKPQKAAKMAAIYTEIKNLKKCNHQNIPRYVNTFLSTDHIFLSMEFVKGLTLDDIIYHIHMDTSTMAYVCTEVLSALEYLQDINIIHRDVKPQNILVSKAGRVKLTDLGLSICTSKRIAGDMSRRICGTTNFMAPEMVTGASYSHGVDIWALGITLFLMVYRQYPYDQRLSKLERLKLIARKSPLELYNYEPGYMLLFYHYCVEHEGKRPSAHELRGWEFISHQGTKEDMARVMSRVLAMKRAGEKEPIVELKY